MYFLQFQIFVEWDVILLKKNVFLPLHGWWFIIINNIFMYVSANAIICSVNKYLRVSLVLWNPIVLIDNSFNFWRCFISSVGTFGTFKVTHM